ncbi:TonB-dependent siderophore receptor [Acetobacter suratthaniensis]|uniref:TonB-dependent siderophore receptor n=1 Tax=Acetobacter suratthaniensis TaxID=1502841 RepID=A0ABS3LMY1_9PROT|nr:TonB-dependent receptor [Acetobacter suratthaniensis]MBO1328706.1 TonB-dependent siderophore receptor [Acetobacter suratthaniensis]MCX2566844.1 TonB-dependent siderophore receptor [Acetobacter suratthaniensis]
MQLRSIRTHDPEQDDFLAMRVTAFPRNRRACALQALGLASALTALSLSGAGQAAAQQAMPDVETFRIPPGALADTLFAFSRQAHVQIASGGAALEHRLSPGVKGTMTRQQALAQLLSGSGLTFQPAGPAAYQLVAASAVASPARGAQAMAPTRDMGIESREQEHILVQGDVIGNASRYGQRHYAGSRTVISSADLHEHAVRSIDDALQRIPGIKIFDETGTGALPQIQMRGLYESRSGRVQILEDGIPLALAPYGQTSVSMFPMTMDMVDHIDVVRGGAALQYGPNNMGGVINIVSRPIPEKWTTSIGERLQIAGNNGHVLANTDFSTGGKLTRRFGVQLDANFQNGNQFRDSHSAANVRNLRLRTEYAITDNDRIRTDFADYEADIDMPGALSPADYKKNPFQSTRNYDSMSGSTYRGSLVAQHDMHRWKGITGGQATLTFFADEASRSFTNGMRLSSSETWRSDLPAQRLQNSPRDFTVYGVQPQMTLRTKAWGVSHEFAFGARYVSEDIHYMVNRQALPSGPWTSFRDWRFNTAAWSTFISDKMGFLNDRLTFTPGFRFEHVDQSYVNTATGQKEGNGTRDILPGVTLGYSIGKTGYVFFDAQKSMRPAQSTEIIYGNKLDTEKAWNYEFGGRWFPNRYTTLALTFYRIDFGNQIEYDSTIISPTLGTPGGYINLGGTRYQGIEFSGDWALKSLPALSFNAAYSFLDARQLNGAYKGNVVPYTSKHQASAGATYKWGQTRFNLNGFWFSRSYTDAANTKNENATGSVGRVPGYVVFNAQVTHTIPLRSDGTKLDLSLAIMNFADERYYFRGMDTSPWGREVAPGRTFQLGSRITF